MLKEFTPLNQVELDDIISSALKARVTIPPRSIAILERDGFTVIHAGDVVMKKMEELLKYVRVKQFDRETWYLYRDGYIVTESDKKLISNNCKYNGNLK